MELICYVAPGWRPRIRVSEPSRPWMDDTPESYAYRFLPLSIANSHGWEILSPCTFAVRWHGGADAASIEIDLSEAGNAEFVAQSVARPREGLSPAAQLELEFDDFEELLGEKNYLLTAMSELLERARRDPEIKAGMFPLMGKWKEIVADLLARGVEAGDFRPDLDPVPAAQMVIGAMIGFSRSPAATVENFKPLRAELLRAVRNPSQDASK